MARSIKTKALLLSLVSFSLLTTNPGLASIEASVPSINPKKNCKLNDVIVPEGMTNYKFLADSQCETFFVRPAIESEQSVAVRPHPNLRECRGFQSATSSLNLIQEAIEKTNNRILELTLKDYSSEEELKRIEKEIDTLEKRKTQFLAEEKKARTNKDSFDNLIGAEFQISMFPKVNSNDLRELEMANLKERVKEDDNGNITKFYEGPTFEVATINKPIFSFKFYSPTGNSEKTSIYSSNIPGLQAYQQEGTDMGIAHVKANGGISGFVAMRLSSLCGYEQEIAPNKFVIQPEGNPIFTVNYTYEVQQQFEYGYEASLNKEMAISQIASDVITNNNSGFTKKQVFENTIKSNMDSILNFEWESTYLSDGHDVNFEELQKIKESVVAGFIDNYFDDLVKSGKLEIVQPKKVKPTSGGHIEEDRTGIHCWTQSDWFGLIKNRKCRNYTYKVKEWKDGKTEKDIEQHLTIDSYFRDQINAKVMYPFYFTSTFRPNMTSN